MRRVLFVLVVIFQLVLIVFLLARIFRHKSQVLGEADYFVIEKASMNFPQIDALTNFYEPKPNSKESINQNKAPQKSTATINNDALNERFDYELVKPKNTFRIITLGDSYTYGLYINTKDNWPEVLEDKLNDFLPCKQYKHYEVINLAVHGYDFQYAVKRYQLRGVKYKPDLVIWFIKDALRMSEKINQYANGINVYLKAINDKNKLNSYYSWNKAWNQVLTDYGEDKILAFQKHQLQDFNKLYSGKLVFVMGAWILGKHQDYFADYLENRDSIWVTQVDLLSNQRFTTDSHPNELGHRYIAEYLFNYLIKDDCKIFSSRP